MKKIIRSANAPEPIGPYSQAVTYGGMLFISGQIAINPATGELNNESIADEARQVMQNLGALLREANMGFEHVIKTSIFLSDMALFDEVNKVYAGFFLNNYPARETVAVRGLPKNVNVEISMVAGK
jgi:2-iminobutanoate/2-iminopropanoate deaminase